MIREAYGNNFNELKSTTEADITAIHSLYHWDVLRWFKKVEGA